MILLTHKSETLFHGSIPREQARNSWQKLSTSSSSLHTSDQHACRASTPPATQAKPHVNSRPLPQQQASQECNYWLILTNTLGWCACIIVFCRAYLYALLILLRHWSTYMLGYSINWNSSLYQSQEHFTRKWTKFEGWPLRVVPP